MWTFKKIIQNWWKQYKYFKFIRIKLNLLKKSDLVQKILDLKGKVVVDADLNKLCEKIERLTDIMNQIVTENKKLQSDIVIIKNVYCKLEKKIVYLEKNQAKGEQ